MLTECRDYRARLIERARGVEGPDDELMAHLEMCADCACVWEEQLALSAALGELACEVPPEMAAIEVRVLAEFDRARWGRRLRLPVAALLAAAAAIGILWVHRPAARVTPTLARTPEVEEPFVTIPYTVPLAPEEQATIVRMEVPIAALIASGFKVETADPGGVVDADVLVSQDGRARAIRLNSK